MAETLNTFAPDALDARIADPALARAVETALHPVLVVCAAQRSLDRLGEDGVVDPCVERVRDERVERLCHRLPPDRCSVAAVRPRAGEARQFARSAGSARA